MNHETMVGMGIILFSNLVAAVSQLLLKTAAKRSYSPWWRSYLNVPVVSGYALFFATTLLSVYALRFIPLSLCAALGATGQIFVPLLCFAVLHEKISRRKSCGMLLIVIGIVFFSL